MWKVLLILFLAAVFFVAFSVFMWERGFHGAFRGFSLRGVTALRTRKRQRKKTILAFAVENGKIANDDVEELLKVSDATATNYLAELVKEGRLEKVGETGRGVFYRPCA